MDRENLVRGFEMSRGKHVQFTEEELESVEAEANRNIELKEFVPLASVDTVYFESSYHLGPDKGAEKLYRLLADALGEKPKGGRRQAGEPRQRADRDHPALRQKACCFMGCISLMK